MPECLEDKGSRRRVLFESLKKQSAQARVDEENLYKMVFEEYDKGIIRHGLWAKAVARSNGQPEKAKSLYIEFRVQALKDEIHLTQPPNTVENRDNVEQTVNSAHDRENLDGLWLLLSVFSGVVLIPLLITIIYNNL